LDPPILNLPETGPATGNVTPLKVHPAQPAKPAQPARPGMAQRARIFENAPSTGQYIYHLNTDIRSFTRAEIEHAVQGCTPIEVQRVARLLAKLRGRYIARLVDLGSTKRAPIAEMDITDLRRAREMVEEVEAGFVVLRQAIEAGDLRLDGIKAE
jgi:hypothetical protein